MYYVGLLGTLLLNFLTTIVSVFVIDIVGRRVLILIPLMCMIIAHLVLCLAIHYNVPGLAIAMVLFFIMAFAIGLGPIPFIITSEVFRDVPRPKAVSVAIIFQWIANIIVSFGFPPVQNVTHEFVFLIFMCLIAIFFVFLFFYLPETKNRSPDDIATELAGSGIVKVAALRLSHASRHGE